MDEEHSSKRDKLIQLSDEEYSDLMRALQWPEDLERFDRIAKPTPIFEIGFNYQRKAA